MALTRKCTPMATWAATSGLSAGTENGVVLTPATKFKGTVIDDKTGQIIPEFTLTYQPPRGIPASPLVSQRIAGMDKDARKAARLVRVYI